MIRTLLSTGIASEPPQPSSADEDLCQKLEIFWFLGSFLSLGTVGFQLHYDEELLETDEEREALVNIEGV